MSKTSKKVRWPRSIFLKIILILILAGFLINLSVGYFFRHIRPDERNQLIANNVNRYLGYLVSEFDNSDTNKARYKARQVLKDLGFDVRYQQGTTTWATDSNIPLVENLQGLDHWNARGGYGRKKGRFFKKIQVKNATYVFAGTFKRFATFSWQTIVALVAIVSLIIFMAWYSIRQLLSPIKLLSRAVSAFGHELNIEVEVRSKDELGELSRAFNQMTRRINQVIEAKDQLLLNVSHEIRTPLTRINLALAMMPDSPQKTAIEEDAAEMQTMITELLENERLKSDHGQKKKETLNLISVLARRAAQYDRVRFREPVNDILIHGDEERINLLVKNLLENALKYSEQKVELKVAVEKEHALIEVIDQGIGIEENEIPHLFEPFYRTDPARSRKTGGYGLGLSLCKNIVEYHQGEIRVQSQKSRGTRVTVSLPLLQPKTR